jgi:hypothetical protein
MSQQLSLERIGLLLRADLMSRARSLLIIAGTLTALLLVQGFWQAGFLDPDMNFFPLWFLAALYVWGPFMASHSFRELHDKAANEAYLLLPASAAEKTVARLLLATVLFGAFIVALLTVVSWLNAAICYVFLKVSVPTFSVFDAVGVQILANALVSQSIFFLGAAWFRKSHFIRTSFALTLGLIGLAVVSVVITRIVYYDVFSGSFSHLMNVDQTAFIRANTGLFDFVSWAAPALYFYLLPPFCWYVAWLRVKETQVSYGI